MSVRHGMRSKKGTQALERFIERSVLRAESKALSSAAVQRMLVSGLHTLESQGHGEVWNTEPRTYLLAHFSRYIPSNIDGLKWIARS